MCAVAVLGPAGLRSLRHRTPVLMADMAGAGGCSGEGGWVLGGLAQGVVGMPQLRGNRRGRQRRGREPRSSCWFRGGPRSRRRAGWRCLRVYGRRQASAPSVAGEQSIISRFRHAGPRGRSGLGLRWLEPAFSQAGARPPAGRAAGAGRVLCPSTYISPRLTSVLAYFLAGRVRMDLDGDEAAA